MGDVDGIFTFLIQFFTIAFSEMITVFLKKTPQCPVQSIYVNDLR